jgi:glycosyltransferase involved in cell wall biosynthesis
MYPSPRHFRSTESGIKRVIEAYDKYLPNYGFEIVPEDAETYDLVVSHAGSYVDCDVLHNHGLYWSAEYDSARWELRINANVVASIRQAKEVIVPSSWVAETFQRDMRFTPHVIPHGIDWEEWEHNYQDEGYIVWNKNRMADVCDPYLVGFLARANKDINFVSTFPPRDYEGSNLHVTGVLEHSKMKEVLQKAAIYLSTTKETFGIGVLEAMAAGVPVLGVNWGGNSELVEHGVNGYLAEPGDEDGLLAGIDYCLKYRDTLGKNGKEMVKKYDWESAVERVAKVYSMSRIDIPPTVSVVIPSYNYAHKVEGAIKSAVLQSHPPEAVIVVDDGSTDDTEAVVKKLVKDNPSNVEIRYIKQENRGVAHARNAGVASASHSKYICCLDADDAIDQDFLRTCVESLERDRSLGIAYTGLEWEDGDGNTGISDWPGTFNYDEQLRGRNQIPTCCVFRRVMWDRLGGYKQKYAPGGAGAEDAEFWLRAGAYGFNARKVTELPLFYYSWKTGRVSGDPDYKEVDWRVFHPWAKDGLHPFASVATPENGYSHLVRSYDKPTISVIIPVSEKHIETVTDALDSLEAQTLRDWEAILVWDNGQDFSNLTTAYPYIRVVVGDNWGAGRARNEGAKLARGSFLLFLDADDWLYPEALEKMLKTWEETGDIAYSDYVGKAFMSYEDAETLGDRLLYYDEKKEEAVIRHYAFDYECERAVRQPDTKDMYIWCLITALVPKIWHNGINGFDEEMPSWEDWDYWIRMAKAGKCFRRIEEPLVVYRFYTGGRREAGLHQHKSLVEYMTRKFIGEQAMPCGCRGSKSAAPMQRAPHQVFPAAAQDQTQGVSSMQDENMVLCVYMSPNQGQHRVVGHATKKNYGYRGGGETFLVHKADIAAAPHLFRRKEETQPTIVETHAPPPPPAPSHEVEAETEPVEIQVLELEQVPGITPQIADALHEMGIHSVDELRMMQVEDLMAVKYVGEKRAELIIQGLTQYK